MTDNDIVEMFFARAEGAVAALDGKYGKKCRKISMSIVGDELDAEECVNDAYLQIWNQVPPDRPRGLAAYVFQIVRFISFKRNRENKAKKRSPVYIQTLEELSEALPAEQDIEKEYESKELGEIIGQFLMGLTAENKAIFVLRYWSMESYKNIAKKLGISEKTISVRLVRIRKKLKEYLEERGIEV